MTNLKNHHTRYKEENLVPKHVAVVLVCLEFWVFFNALNTFRLFKKKLQKIIFYNYYHENEMERYENKYNNFKACRVVS